jgi:hypothetical protein
MRNLRLLLALLPALAFGQATIFVPADNAVRAQKPVFQVLESGSGGQHYSFSMPSMASNLTWTLPAAYCSSGQGLSFSDATGTLACTTLYQPGNFTTSYVLFGDGDSIPATSSEFQITSGGFFGLTIGNATGASNGILTLGGASGQAQIAAGSGVITFNGTGAIKVPAGSDAQQPGTPVDGMFRYNEDDDGFEGYINGAWGPIGGGGSGAIATVSDTATIDLAIASSDLTANIVTGSITNSMVNASAAIALSKLATVTASKALVSDGSGFISASAVTATELGYLTGVTSAIQTQFTGKLSLTGGTMSGAIAMGTAKITGMGDPTAAQDAATKAYVDGSNNTFTGTTITGVDYGRQKFRYTGASAQVLTTFTITSIPDGATLTVTGSSNTNTITIPTGMTNVRMNGEWVGAQYSAITFIKDSTNLIEVSRNDI